MPLVIDASLAFHLILSSSEQEQVRDIMRSSEVAAEELYAPSLWTYELTSALGSMVYHNRISEAEARVALETLFILPVELIYPGKRLTMAAYDWTLRLNRSKAYDSFYVALAEILGCELWTMDKRLINAVGEDWVRCPVE